MGARVLIFPKDLFESDAARSLLDQLLDDSVFITAAPRVINLFVTTAENSSKVLNSNHFMLQSLLNWSFINVLVSARDGGARA